jgi:hypothetical protein
VIRIWVSAPATKDRGAYSFLETLQKMFAFPRYLEHNRAIGGKDPRTQELIQMAKIEKVARELAEMATGDFRDGEVKITYTPTGKRIKSANGTVWHSMLATTDDGREWDYWLARDYSSYKGSF